MSEKTDEVGSRLNSRLNSPLESEDHASFRKDMCEWKLLGGLGASCYYVSILVGKPCMEMFVGGSIEPARKLANQLTNGASEAFRFEMQSLGAMWPLFEVEFNQKYPHLAVDRKWIKQDEAVVCLLNNPTFGDNQVAIAVPTTVKQLSRFTDYNLLRRFQKQVG